MISFQENWYTFGNLTTCISDHVPQFTIIQNLLSDRFQISKLVSGNTKQTKHEKLMLIINNLLDKHVSFKEQAKRKKILRFKPWIAKCIFACIERRDKIYKEKIKEKNSQTKLLKSSLYKKYCNITFDILKKARNSTLKRFLKVTKKIVKQFGTRSMK